MPPQVESVAIGPRPGAAPGDLRPFLLLRLGGAIPPAARNFVWADAVKAGTYLLTLRQDGDENVSRQFLEPRQESNPFLLGPQVVPPTRFQETLRHAPVALGVVAVLALGLLVRARRGRAAAVP